MSLLSESPVTNGREVVETAGDSSADEGTPPPEKGGQRKAPRKVQKAEREKHKRDQLNDRFNELGSLLEQDRQNNGKASILSDATRILKDLLSQVEFLRKENATLLNESHYVNAEKNELKDENNLLRGQICELRNEFEVRIRYNPMWAHQASASHPGTVISLPPQPLVIEQQRCPSPPRELQLFPESTSATDHEPAFPVTRPQARYATQSGPWTVQLLHGLPIPGDDENPPEPAG